MPNIKVVRVVANERTPLYAPIAARLITLENADPSKGFSFSGTTGYDQRDIAPGFGLPIEVPSGIREGDLLGYVQGGVIVVSVGIGLAQRVSAPTT